MAEQPSRGRARGRGRGQQQQQQAAPVGQMAQMTLGASPTEEGGNGNSDNGNGNGSGAAMRGRGGYRAFDPVTRPATASVGNKGAPIRLVTNYFKMQTNPDLIVYQYHVTFDPPEIERNFKRKAIRSQAELFNNTYIYDGDATLFVLNDAGDEHEFFEQLPEANVRVTVKRTTEVSGGDPRHTVEMIRVYNTMMRKFQGRYLKLIQIRQYLYSHQNKINIPEHHISIWPGVVTSTNRHDGGLMICCDPVYKVVRSDNVLDILRQLREKNPQGFQADATRELSGATVMTHYNNKCYRIDDVQWKMRPSQLMPGDDSRTYIDYYRERYNINLRDQNQPLLLVKESIRDQLRADRRTQPEHQPRQILLIPELCLMTGLSETMLSDFRMKKAMAEHTRPQPARRIDSVRRFMSTLMSNQKVREEMTRWGTRYTTDPIEIPGRILPHEAVCGRDNFKFPYDHKTDDFIAQIRSKPLRVTTDLNNWYIIATQRDGEYVNTLCQTMRRVCSGMQIGLRPPQVKLVQNPQVRSFVEECKKVDQNADIVLVICPDNRADRYSAMKKLFCCEMGINSQVVLAKNVKSKGFMSICTKLALQMACKIGAEPWCMDIPTQGIMVVGFDTHHDTQSGPGPKQSWGGFVASLNPSLSKWFSRVRKHGQAVELSNNFASHMTEALKYYHKVNGRNPDWIVVYRDGVGEGQIDEVHKNERLDIEKAIKSQYTGIQLTFIIVSKRINTRLFARQPGGNEIINPPPGTVVDTVITRPTRFEFYLVSQSVRQGTVAPTSFNIIHDDSNKSANVHQMLAYKMTHMYYNWPGTIRVPAPCQYAHKLAFLTGTALGKEPHVRLSDKVFYL